VTALPFHKTGTVPEAILTAVIPPPGADAPDRARRPVIVTAIATLTVIPTLAVIPERCPFATTVCGSVAPPLTEVAPGHVVACHYVDQAERFRVAAAEPGTWAC
jgi:hypothetical protein